MNRKNIENIEIVDLLNEIYKIPGDTILDRLVGLSEKYDIDIRELGDTIADSEDMKKKIWLDCVKHNIIVDPGATKLLERTETLDLW